LSPGDTERGVSNISGLSSIEIGNLIDAVIQLAIDPLTIIHQVLILQVLENFVQNSLHLTLFKLLDSIAAY
jgi:hypothetical protein